MAKKKSRKKASKSKAKRKAPKRKAAKRKSNLTPVSVIVGRAKALKRNVRARKIYQKVLGCG